MNYIPRGKTPSLKRVASVFANEQNRTIKSERDIAQNFDENTLEQYALVDAQKVNMCYGIGESVRFHYA